MQVPLQHRLAATFRSGRAFLAGDAAHVHSPAGAQGMNSGIQDAINLGWKLGLAAQGIASEALLDTYSGERRPVARAVLALTHALFWIESADGPVVRRARVVLAPPAVSMALRLGPLRTLGFRIIGQQWVRYPRGLAAVDGLPKLRRGPGAGHRLPDLLLLRDQVPCRLHQALATPAFHLLLCGPPRLGPSAAGPVPGTARQPGRRAPAPHRAAPRPAVRTERGGAGPSRRPARRPVPGPARRPCRLPLCRLRPRRPRAATWPSCSRDRGRGDLSRGTSACRRPGGRADGSASRHTATPRRPA
jgi:hypothetical protein